MRRGADKEALAELGRAEERYRHLGDVPLNAAIHLATAQAHARRGNARDAARRLLAASELDVTSIRELQAQYYYAAALVLGDGSPAFARQLADRATRLWAHQGIVSVRLEMTDADAGARPVAAPAAPPGHLDVGPAARVASSLSALCDLADTPRLLGEEMAATIEALGCSSEVTVVETPAAKAPPRPSPEQAALTLGIDGRADPERAVLLGDVLRIGRAALALERARREERSRAALWPADPVEEQAGALFISQEMQELLAHVRRIAATPVPVLITGETGTGKEVLARTIHACSPRAAAAFLPFNCSSVPRDMLDVQMFGHRKGAFTGASESFPGVIRSASGGTLFLDEIGEITLDVQPKLLRFLESGEVHPIGEARPVRADVRVIAATNADLGSLISQGRFRDDLFYRLNVLPLHLPPLRERRVEIPAFARHFLLKHAQECRKGNLRLAEETMEYLILYRWPGNVRQLANEMRRLAVLAEPDAVLMPEHLSADIATSRRTIPASDRTLTPNEVVVRTDQPLAAAVQHLERTMIQRAMTTTGGRVEETASVLGLSRKGLYLKRLKYGLEVPGAGGTSAGAA